MTEQKKKLIEKQKQMYASLTDEQLSVVNDYFVNNMKKLRNICDPIILQKKIPLVHYDDLYAVAADTLIESLTRYDVNRECSFKTFLIGNIKRAFCDWVRDSIRLCRCNLKTDGKGKIIKDKNNRPIIIPCVSIDAQTEDGIDLCEKISSEFKIEDALHENILDDDRVEQYISSLSDRQKKIANLIMQGYSPAEIKKELELTENQYVKALKEMKSFEKSRILKHKDYVQIEEELTKMQTQTLEKSKPDKLSVGSIIKKIDNYTIRFDHPLQRQSDQWAPAMKGNLISDILQRNPLPPLVFAEQVVNDLAVIWDLDGKQRCTNVYSFKNDGFRITKNIRRWNISYQARVKENGKQVLDENGFPESERREFDIRGKKFSDLPEELQDRFLEYNFEIIQYLNCSSEDIAYHIARYNEGKPMSASQRGITRLGEEFATMVKSISAMPFFKEQGGYKVSEGSNGTVDRVVVESVMASNFLSDWKRKQEDMCEFMKENATTEMFDNFEDMVSRISKVGTEETLSMFDSKDSFIWFGLYARFVNTGIEDKKFINFMAEFAQSLHSKEINGVSYDVINETRATKDKNVVTRKIEHLTKLMYSYLDIYMADEKKENENILEFVKNTVSPNITEEDIEEYYDMLDGYKKIINKDNTKLLDWRNEPSVISLIAYSFIHDIDLDDWIKDYSFNNKIYLENQKENYEYMVKSLNHYMRAQDNLINRNVS